MRNGMLKAGDMIEAANAPTDGNGTVVSVVVYAHECAEHVGNVLLVVADYDIETVPAEHTGAESDWCAPAREETFVWVGHNLKIAQDWNEENFNEDQNEKEA